MIRRLSMACIATALLAGCAVAPNPFPQAEHIRRSLEDRSVMFARQAPITAAVSLEEALARALLHNLDQRLSMFEQALQLRQLDLANLDMLPRLTANAGYKVRDREEVKWSKDYYTGVRGTNPSVGEDTQIGTADLTLQWSVLDFGVSYLQALQQADRGLIARERRRRTINNMFQEVRTAYWQAAAAQRVRGDLRPVLTDALFALETLRDIERRRAQPLAANLRAQRQILDLIRQLEGLELELQTATARLAQLMGLPANANFDVEVLQPADMRASDVPFDIDTMERIALVSRPEVREEAYNVRIAQNEARRGMLRLLPNLNFLAQHQYNDNSFLHTRTWNEASARVTFNLFALISLPEQRRLGDTQKQVAELRRQAVSMAVVTQVNLALRTYARSVNTFQRATEIAEVEQRLAEIGAQQQQAQTVADLDRIRGRAEAIVAELERDRAFASLQNALASVYASLGVDLLPETVEANDLPSLTRAIRIANQGLISGRLNLAGLPIDDLAQQVQQVAESADAPTAAASAIRSDAAQPAQTAQPSTPTPSVQPDGVRRTRWWIFNVEFGGQTGGADPR
jgi:multidrug efflux system outer membrane protein